MTPEARYATTFRAWALDDQKRHDEHFTKAIREAVAEAFEEAQSECARLAARHALNAKDPARGCDRKLAEEREIAALQCVDVIRVHAKEALQ